MRILLFHVKGPRSFKSLRTVDNTVHDTFKDACKALHLLSDNKYIEDTLNEAIETDTSNNLISLFAMLIVYCNPNSINELWEKFYDDLIEAIIYKFNLKDVSDNKLLENLCLSEIQNEINLMDGKTVL